MQATAHPTGTRTDAPAEQETRPVRLLVPTVRHDEYFLPLEDTLRASDLGVTRETTDAELLERVDTAAGMLHSVSVEDPTTYLFRIRDALRAPRDITEAREWGFHIPVEENKQEFEEDKRKHLNWWWVYDPEHVETRQQREARYLSDQRVIDMKGYARVTCRAYITIKDLKFASDQIRKILSNEDGFRTTKAQEIAAENGGDVAAVEMMLLADARRDVLKAMPPRRFRGGQSDQWYVRDAIVNGRNLGRLNEWYEFNTIRQTGRPRGSRTRNRTRSGS
jgi:hypothetical protein